MLIKKLVIKNFKSFKHQEINDLSNVNMIYGYNNSGKSNLLKFIELIFRRKQSEKQTTHSATEESYTEESLSNWWEGMIEDEPFIFRNNERSKDIEFTFVIAAPREKVEELVTPFEDFKEAYFSDQDVKEAQQELEDLQKEIQKAEDQKEPENEIIELREKAGKASNRFDALTEANNENGDSIELEISGRIKARGKYDAEMILDSAKVFGRLIFEKADDGEEYFGSVKEDSVLKEDPYLTFNELLSLFDDAVLFLDNDRYFIAEEEDKNVEYFSPKTFKNWLYNLYLDPYSFERYNEILEGIEKFRPRGAEGEGKIKIMEQNSPLNSLNVDFGRSKDGELMLLLQNGVLSDKRLPIENFGTGIQQVFYILASISEFKPKVILLEEIELNLSPKYQEDLVQHILLKLIQNEDKDVQQLFFTTHSPLLSIHHDYQIHQVSIDGDGESNFSKVDKTEISKFYPSDVIQEIIDQHNA